MGNTYRAVEISSPGVFSLVERKTAAPGAGQVRIRIEACGVCHSDAATVEGQWPGLSYPRVPGHEAIGRIEEIGTGVMTWKVVSVSESDSSEAKMESARPAAVVKQSIAKIPS